MKLQLTAQILTGLALAIGSIAMPNQPSQAAAEGTTFFCGMSKGVPVTYARTPRGNVPMIRWVNNKYFSSSWTPNRRCQEVSKRFQSHYNSGTLQSITTGKLKGYPVVCAATSQDQPCTDKTLLFTLKRGTNANRVLEKLLDTRGLAAGNIVNEAGGCTGDTCPVYLNVDVYLNNVAVEGNTP